MWEIRVTVIIIATTDTAADPSPGIVGRPDRQSLMEQLKVLLQLRSVSPQTSLFPASVVKQKQLRIPLYGVNVLDYAKTWNIGS